VRETDRLLYFVMKFIAGRPLDGVLKELGPLPIPMIQMILQQVGSAFGYAHRRGIIHRDIKPANIMIDEEGWAVVTDFGIAKVSQAEGLTMTGMTVGTPTYMSPEQCMAQDVTGASDQYSLGVVAYEMITGRPPFAGGSMMAIMYGHFNDAPPDISTGRPDCPPELRHTVMRMLEKDPAKRWPSMEDAVDSMGEPPAKSDDMMRSQLVELAKKSENTAMLKRYSTPVSPAPLTKGARPGRGQATGAKPAGPATPGSGLPRTGGTRAPQTVVVGSPPEKSKAPLFIGLGLAAAAVIGVLVVKVLTSKSDEPSVPIAIAPAPVTDSQPSAQQPAPSNPAQGQTTPPVTNPQLTVPAAPDTTASNPSAATNPPADQSSLRQGRREFLQLISRNKDARNRALAAGASPRDLSAGDNLRRTAERLSAKGEWKLAISSLSDGTDEYGNAESAAKARVVADARIRAQADSVAKARAEPPPQQAPTQPIQTAVPVPAPAAPADERPAVELVLREYARALFARDMPGMLAAWPSMPAATRDAYKKLFDKKNYMDTNGWRYLDFSVSGSTAIATLGGITVLLDDHRKPYSNEPFPRKASLEKVEGRWRLTNLE
jgi:serine/threonine-protein kinase